MSSSKYTALGASASKSGIHAALHQLQLTPSLDLFCKIEEDIARDPTYRSFIHGDGAGTKSIVAYLLYRESGDPQVFASLAQDSLVMNLDDILCLGTPENLIVSNAIARNLAVIPDEAIQAIIGGYLSLVEQLRTFGVPISLGGGETADCGDIVRTLVVDSTISGRIKAENVIRLSRIQTGDCIVGLSSAGRSSYESEDNSGIGSNGLTLARHALLRRDYATRYPEIVAPESAADAIYRGPYVLGDKPDRLEMSIGEALRSPTRTYAPLLLALYRELGSEIHGVIHLTGGAHTKILRFGNALTIRKSDPLPVPEIFRLIQTCGEVSHDEMYRVFNMGSRIEIYLPERFGHRVTEIARSFGIGSKIVGAVVDSGKSREVTIHAPDGEIHYHLNENDPNA